MRKIYPEKSFDKALEYLKNAPLGPSSQIKDTIIELGSISPEYFKNKYKGGLELQQVPDELDQLSRALIQKYSGNKINYLEIGVGSCGTLIFLTYLFKKNNIEASLYAIDNLNHYHMGLFENQKSRIKWCQDNIGLNFYNMDTGKPEFSDWLKNKSFDVILVDGDHSFEGCLWDFTQCVRSLKNDGWIILHDITSDACPGVREVFELNKNVFKKSYIYSNSTTCGIGVLEGPPEYTEFINKMFHYLIEKNKIITVLPKPFNKQLKYLYKFREWIKIKKKKLKYI